MRFRLPLSFPFIVGLIAPLCSALPATATDPSPTSPRPASLQVQVDSGAHLPECRYPRLVTEAPSNPTILSAAAIGGVRREHLSADVAEDEQPARLTTITNTALFSDLFKTLSLTYERLGYPVVAALVTIDSPVANAFVRKHHEVVITTTLINKINERSEAAFILAHELAHIALKHGAAAGIDAEVAADTLALKVVTALSLDPCSGSSVLERLGRPSELTLASLQPRLTALHDKTFDVCG